MVLGDGVASARLELRDGIRRHGRAEGYALLNVHVEPRGADGAPALPVSPASWRRRFERALQLPAAFAVLLSGELGQATSGEPPAQATRLEAPDMTDLVYVTGLAMLPGARRLSQFMVYLAACPDGASTASAADTMTRQMLEEALKADLDSGIELQADHAGSGAGPGESAWPHENMRTPRRAGTVTLPWIIAAAGTGVIAGPADTSKRVLPQHRIWSAAPPQVPGLRPGDPVRPLAVAGASARHRPLPLLRRPGRPVSAAGRVCHRARPGRSWPPAHPRCGSWRYWPGWSCSRSRSP